MWQLSETFCKRLEDAASPEGEGWEPLQVWAVEKTVPIDMAVVIIERTTLEGYRIIWRRWTGETPRILDPDEVHAVLFGKR
jgi:hypothetical protein